uniref:Putative ovule protein n=1 Tax=Solanum chacoense TaxID=4108 RepID=A0A0V0GN30_SOLCH
MFSFLSESFLLLICSNDILMFSILPCLHIYVSPLTEYCVSTIWIVLYFMLFKFYHACSFICRH